jgi:toxin ParE1/3/4
MTYTVKAAARADLRAIARYIAKDNPARAVSYTEEIFAKIEAVAAQPKLYQERSEWDEGLRSVMVRSHRILFRIVDSKVVVLRILYGSREVSGLV